MYIYKYIYTNVDQLSVSIKEAGLMLTFEIILNS